MSRTCSDSSLSIQQVPLPAAAPAQVLAEIACRFGTPTYAYDLTRIRAQAGRLRAAFPLPIELLYSLKANASLGLCSFLARQGLGADVASAGELVTAIAAGFAPERIFISGPDRSPSLLADLRQLPDVLVSADSAGELELLAGLDLPHRILLRLRPDYDSFAVCTAAADSRFGVPFEELPSCRAYRDRIVGFHIFSGSQVLDPAGVIHHLRHALDLARRAAQVLGLVPQVVNLGGGFGIPYHPGDCELDLSPIAEEVLALSQQAAPARLVLELGRYLVASSGWYLTTVLVRQTRRGRPAVVVDGGTHQRADL